MWFITYVLVPNDVFIKGDTAIHSYVETIMHPNGPEARVKPYIVKTRKEMQQDPRYNELNGGLNIFDFYDSQGNALSTRNPTPFYHHYTISMIKPLNLLAPQIRSFTIARLLSFGGIDNVVDLHGIWHVYQARKYLETLVNKEEQHVVVLNCHFDQ